MTDDPTPQPDDPTPDERPAADQPAPEELRKALKAFKKRLKLARLDADSQLGRGAMTGGSRSGIVSIQPPREFPKTVWDELVRQGRLKYVGNGLYEPVES